MTRIVQFLDESGFLELVERAVQGGGPQVGLAVGELLHRPRNTKTVEVRVGEGEQDQVDAVLHALYQTV